MSAVQGAELIATCVQGGACHRGISHAEAVRLARGDQLVWLHVQVGDHDEATRFLRDDLHFHELAVEDALSPNERPALTVFDDYIFLVVPAVSSREDNETYVEVGFFLTRTSIVSVVDAKCAALDEWLDRWSKHPFEEGMVTADLLHVLVDAIVDEYLPVIDGIEDDVDAISDSIFAGEKGKVMELLGVKRRLLNMRRRIVPLRDVVNGLLRRDLDLVPDKTRPYFQDVYDHSARIAESIDLQRDTLTSLLDVHLSVVSNNLNDVMKKMTVIATVLMNAALIAGIYGMNFKFMPELSWYYGYPFALTLMTLTSLGILALFRWKKWL